MKFLFFGDWHITDKDNLLFFHGHQKIMHWLEGQYNLSTTIFIQAGDLFDKDIVHHDEVMAPTIDFLLKFKACHVVEGNHEEDKKGSILTPLSRHPSIHIYQHFEEVIIENFFFGMFPHYYDYEDHIDYSTIDKIYDFRIIHRHPPGFNNGKEETTFQVPANYATFYGHFHEPRGEAIGVPQTTRNREQPWKKRYYEFDTENKELKEIYIPAFFNIQTIQYGETVTNTDYLYNIENAPSKRIAEEMYKHVSIRKNGISLQDNGKDTSTLRLEDGQTKVKMNLLYGEWKKEYGNTARQEVLDELDQQIFGKANSRNIR